MTPEYTGVLNESSGSEHGVPADGSLTEYEKQKYPVDRILCQKY